MKRLAFLLFAATCLLVLSAPRTSLAQTPQVDPFIRENNAKRAQNAEGVSFTVRFKDNKKGFYQGEEIILELAFAASTPKTFTLNDLSYDRSGRPAIDDFVLDREDGVVDPLDDYFNSQIYGFVGGGLAGMPELTDKPELMDACLNQWMRFDKPGHYRLYIISPRVRRSSKTVGVGNPDLILTSNVLEFDILPGNKKWASQKLNDAITALSKSGDTPRGPCQTIRFLGTKAAVSEMVKRLRGEDSDCDFHFNFGLIGSPHRDFVIKEMQNALSLPDQPVTTEFLDTLSLLEFTRQMGKPEPYPETGESEQVQWQAQIKRRRSAYDQMHASLLRQLLTATPQKEGRARATSLQTLLDYKSELNTGELSQWPVLLASMPDLLNRLPMDSRNRLLTDQWKTVASPAMLPVLREILKRSETETNYERGQLRDLALLRLYELAPEEGRRIIIDEIRSPNPRMGRIVLRSLSDETLPELDDVLASNLEESRRTGGEHTEIISELIQRYATGAISSRVQAVYEAHGNGRWACSPQAAMLAYFLRVEPAIGSEYLNKALAARGKGFTGCYNLVLNDVAKLYVSPELVSVAMASLDDDDVQVVSNAARIVAEHGEADAEKTLWRRMEKWHAEMESQSKELSKQQPGVPTPENPLSGQAMIEQALRNALARGRAWLATPEKLKRLRDLCLTDGGRNEVDQWIDSWKENIYIDVNTINDDSASFFVAHYLINSIDLLKERLAQFPKGTSFTWRTAWISSSATRPQQVFQQIKSYVEERGMKLEQEVEP